MKQNLLDEIFSSIIHGMGFIASVVGIILFFIFQTHDSTIWRIVGFSIFSSSLILMYLFSTLFHSLIFTKAKHVFAILDHSSIFLLIAGTYSYFLLTNLRGTTGWILLSFIWALCIGGIIFKTFFVDKHKIVSTAIYIFLGWIIIFFIQPLIHKISAQILILLIFGGVIYTLGTVFYATKKIPFAHSIWHMFVVIATVCHFFAIFLL